MNRDKKKQAFFELGVFLAIVIVLNIISSFLFTRFDFTKEKRFSLSKNTKELIKDLPDIVYVKVYLEGDFPAGFKRLRNSTKEILDEFRAYSGGNIEYEFINPSGDPNMDVRKQIYSQLMRQGLNPVSLNVKDDKGASQQVIFPGAIVTYRDRQVSLQLLQSQLGVDPEEVLNNSIQNLEYQLANSIKKATAQKKPSIAFVNGHAELDTFQTGDIIHTLAEYYQVEQLHLPSTAPKDLDRFSAIIIAKPRLHFSEGEKFNIDQYIMKGGKVLWLIDNLDEHADSLGRLGMTLTSAYDLNLDDQLFSYGARVNYDLIQDLQCAPIPVITGNIGNRPQQQLLPWLFFPMITNTGSHPLARNLEGIKGEYVSTIDTIKTSGIKKTVLLRSSPYTKVLNSPVRISLSTLAIEPNQQQFTKSNQPIALLLEGAFSSVFKNRLVARNDSAKFISEGKPTRMIVVSDGDMIKNDVSLKDSTILPLGYDRFTEQTYGNKNFILNAIDFLADDNNLMEARNKEIKLRLLDKARIKSEKIKWELINILTPVFLVIAFGIFYFYRRKRKYIL